MKPIAKLFSLLLALVAVAAVVYWWIRLLQLDRDEDDPYFHYGDSMYRGNHGEPIRFESDEETHARQAAGEEPFIPAGRQEQASNQ